MNRLAKLASFACIALGVGALAPTSLHATESAQLLAQATPTVTLRFSHVLGPREPFHEGFLAWARAVEQRTNGGLKMEVFHSSSLGREEDIIEQLRQGANLGQNTDAARLGNYVPQIAVVNGPYFAATAADIERAARTPSLQRWQAELADRHGLKVVCFNWVQGARHFFTNKPIRRPEDLRGLRVRTPPAPIWQESVRALGAAPVAMAFSEMYPALQQRAIDGVELVYNNIPAGRFHEVLRYANESRHILLANFQVVGTRFFNSLPPAYQTALVEECERVGAATSQRIQELEGEVKADLRRRGMTIVEDVDHAAFQEAGKRAYQALNLTEAKAAIDREMGR
ncbi:MAG: C4-dicarboxylate TRAP transporter substrate-binding protein [Rhodospirillales bacterium]|jgi:TRAP-type C4-dicarboxylate transport system substrate-binding protein